MKSEKIKKEHFRFVLILAIALGTRQLAMSLIVPFIAGYTQHLLYGTLALGGIALGIFSLTQGIFQVPFGTLCDKIGSKKVVLLGLGILILGLFLACVSNNAYVYVISRALQGSGAITSAGYAWISNTVDEKERADSISLVGAMVGVASAISLGGGPLLISFLSIKTLYIISTILVTIVFILVLIFLKEERVDGTKVVTIEKPMKTGAYLKELFKNKTFVGYMAVTFMVSYIGLAAFFIIPEYIRSILGENGMWKILTPSIIIAIIAMKISTRYIKRGKLKNVTFVSGILLICGSALLLTQSKNLVLLFIESITIFGAYTIVGALIPTVINDIVRNEFRGLVNGITNGFTYFGSFLGATLSGVLWSINLNLVLYIIIIFAICTIGISIFVLKNKVAVTN
ncbi:MAG: MFS transporter [Sarcina sp.]